MIIYNVTVIIQDEIHDEWIQWMKETHIPQVMLTGIFTKNSILKVVDSPNEGHTYCFQYHCASMSDYQTYQQKYAPALQADHTQRYQNKFVAYRSIMEVVE